METDDSSAKRNRSTSASADRMALPHTAHTDAQARIEQMTYGPAEVPNQSLRMLRVQQIQAETSVSICSQSERRIFFVCLSPKIIASSQSQPTLVGA